MIGGEMSIVLRGVYVISIRIMFYYSEIVTCGGKREFRSEVIIGGSPYGVNQFLF